MFRLAECGPRADKSALSSKAGEGDGARMAEDSGLRPLGEGDAHAERRVEAAEMRHVFSRDAVLPAAMRALR